MLCLAALLMASTPSCAAQQDPLASPDDTSAARAAWNDSVSAMTLPGEIPPVTAFVLQAEVLTRQGVQSNQFDATYRYLQPAYIRFSLGTKRETGRGPGRGQASYWLKDGDVVTVLSGREFKQDRDLVRRMTIIAQNILALSEPAKIRTEQLELREQAPTFLPEALAWEARRLRWVEFVSPDFDLYQDEPSQTEEAQTQRRFRVLVGADGKNHLPRYVLLREETPADATAAQTGEPLLFDLRSFRAVNGHLLPHTILVREYDLSGPLPAFRDQASQEIYVTFADLDPQLTEESFRP